MKFETGKLYQSLDRVVMCTGPGYDLYAFAGVVVRGTFVHPRGTYSNTWHRGVFRIYPGDVVLNNGNLVRNDGKPIS